MTSLATGRWASRTIAAGVALALLAAIGLAAWQWPSIRASREARRALAEGRYREAWEIADRWVGERPRSAEAHYLRAKAALALGRNRYVSDGIKRARALGYPEAPLDVLGALIDAQYGRMPRALPVLERAFAGPHDRDPMLDEALARIYLETYDFPHAGAVLERWAADAPEDPRPPLWHATVHRRLDAEPAVIIADYREVLRRSPGHPEALLGLAGQLERARRGPEAADAYAAYLAIRPDDPAGHIGAGRVAGDLGDDPGALRHLDRALALDPEDRAAHLERGKRELRRGQPASALPHLDRAVQLGPFDPVAHYQRSLALKQLGRTAEALIAHRTFTRLQEGRRNLDDLQQDLAASPKDPHLRTRLARWMFDNGYDDEAVLWSRKILADAPGYPETCLLLARYYDRLGQPERARAYREQMAAGRSRPGVPDGK